MLPARGLLLILLHTARAVVKRVMLLQRASAAVRLGWCLLQLCEMFSCVELFG